MQKMHRFLFIISILATFFLSCEKPEDQPLAVVNGKPISLNSFLPRYNAFLIKSHQPDNLLNRNLFLNSLIDEILIVDYAHENDMVHDPAVLREKQRMYDQLLLNYYFDHQITPRTTATEPELRRLFTWSKMSLHVRHLFARDLESIKAIKKELQNGADWNALAKNCFNDTLLKENGGDIGWMNMDDMDPAFEVAAYSLKGDEISDPVKTQYGFSIIQVIEREKDIFLTEQDYQLEKEWLTLMAAQYKKLPAIRAYTDIVEANLGLRFSQNDLVELFDAIVNDTESSQIFSHSPLVYFEKGHYWTVQETYNKLNDLSLRQFNHITTAENLKSVISGLAVRDVFLQEAEKLKLHKAHSFTETITQKYHAHLINLSLEKFYETIPLEEINRNQRIKTAYLNFRNGLADKSLIRIDSLEVKSFILNQRVSS